jgi:hypothetical protein
VQLFYTCFYLSPTTALCWHNFQHVSNKLYSHHQGVNYCRQYAARSKSQTGNYTYVAVCILCYICRFKITKEHVHRILKAKIYKNVKYIIQCPNIRCEPLLMLCGRDPWLGPPCLVLSWWLCTYFRQQLTPWWWLDNSVETWWRFCKESAFVGEYVHWHKRVYKIYTFRNYNGVFCPPHAWCSTKSVGTRALIMTLQSNACAYSTGCDAHEQRTDTKSHTHTNARFCKTIVKSASRNENRNVSTIIRKMSDFVEVF